MDERPRDPGVVILRIVCIAAAVYGAWMLWNGVGSLRAGAGALAWDLPRLSIPIRALCGGVILVGALACYSRLAVARWLLVGAAIVLVVLKLIPTMRVLLSGSGTSPFWRMLLYQLVVAHDAFVPLFLAIVYSSRASGELLRGANSSTSEK